MQVDLTPPPIGDLLYPRVYPDRHNSPIHEKSTSADGIRYFFIKQYNVQPSWNTLFEGQKDWEPMEDPETGELEAFWSMTKLETDGSVSRTLLSTRAHGGFSSYGDADVPGGLELGMAYVMKIVFRNRAGLTATAYSEEI
eukprot:6257001-Prymnesium_polylepis.1